MGWRQVKLELDLNQFRCPDCGRAEMNQDFLNKMATIQFGMSERLVINSGFRCEKHNREVGGSPTSKHMFGLAADIKAVSSAARMLLVQLAIRNGIRGIGIAKDFVHLDLRESTPVLWTYPLTGDEVG